MLPERKYIAIDLKSFYASVECVDRGLDPLVANLVVADPSRTDKTICLAVSPSLKEYGIPGRARLFEVVQKVGEANAERRRQAGCRMTGRSIDSNELARHPGLELDFIVAPPRMAHYKAVSRRIYDIYCKYISPEDIHVYSIDEVFMDVTTYLDSYRMTAHELAMTMIRDVLAQTGITGTAGIGSNMYLCKVAMDVLAKHIPADADGVRIGELDEMSYRCLLWDHKPLTSFWRLGQGTAKKLAAYGVDTMGKLARLSLQNEDLLYRLFGVNAELLIDHAWGWEPCTIDKVKAYRPESNSFSRGQVLTSPYTFEKARIVAMEMADDMALGLLSRKMVTDQVVLTIGYDTENLSNPEHAGKYRGEVTVDHYGRRVPRHSHGTGNLSCYTSSSRLISEAVMKLFDALADPSLSVRRITLTVNHVIDEANVSREERPQQLELFTDYGAETAKEGEEQAALEKERRLQEARLLIKRRFGKNAILKGVDFEEGATTIERNLQIGGHKA